MPLSSEYHLSGARVSRMAGNAPTPFLVLGQSQADLGDSAIYNPLRFQECHSPRKTVFPHFQGTSRDV